MLLYSRVVRGELSISIKKMTWLYEPADLEKGIFGTWEEDGNEKKVQEKNR